MINAKFTKTNNMNNENNTNYCLQGSVKQAVCKETPFHANSFGAVCFNGEEVLTRTRWGKEIPFDRDYLKSLLEALNYAYKLGYEKDRWVN